MSDDLIRRSDAIKAMQECFQVLARQRVQAVKMIEAIPSADIPQKIVAQITFDEEKLREIVKEAVERFKEEYEIEPKRGEWIEWVDCEGEVFWKCSACGQVSEASAAGILYKFCPFCGTRMKGADDEMQ